MSHNGIDRLELAKARYLKDPAFHHVVDAMASVALQCQWTTEDFAEALDMADLLIQAEYVRREYPGGAG